MTRAEREPDTAKRTLPLQAAEKIVTDRHALDADPLSVPERSGRSARAGGYIANARATPIAAAGFGSNRHYSCAHFDRRHRMHPMKPPPFLISAVVLATLVPQALSAQTKPRIGVIGAGKIGGQLARFWANAGYPVMVSSLNLDEMKKLAADIDDGARAGTARGGCASAR